MATPENTDETLDMLNEDEYGVNGNNFSFWLIKEALQSGTDILTRQEKTIDALRTQATSMLGWFVTLTTAVTFASVSANKIAVGACMAALGCIACVCCIVSLLPQKWVYKEFEPQQILEAQEESEKDFKYANALGYQYAIKINKEALDKTTTYIKYAWLIFCLMPPAGILFYFILS
ncbi:hypothetical protein FKW31_12240 [Acetobacter sp. DmW_136]|uniref:hypothetical protein n=1 Tax=Acetobacter sp. DmW_136 TaxID=2591091 RepID=UPI00123A21B4|nr:hypothetical protein [Acetobacter sp. DmW_136]KAA8384321.1 hypothetical protein FKW31_12240 [Acetobacter sp. DmW_136]